MSVAKPASLLRTTTRRLEPLVPVPLRIRLKWLRDRLCLPLSPQHFELYCNIHRICLEHLGEFPDLVHCRDFNDKIQWIKLFDQTSETIRCSDKLGVREYVKDRIGAEYLVGLYQFHDRFSKIDFEHLPSSFVIKTNHDSGTVILVRDEKYFDRHAAERRIDHALRHVYGWENGEWAYACVYPQVLVEEFISPSAPTPPPDYKFHCVNGKVRWVQYIFDRGYDTKEVIADLDGNPTDTHLYQKMKHSTCFTPPPNWEQMKSLAEKVAAGFKYVRVDMYCTGTRIYVGEMTFFPMMGCYTGDGQRKIGRLMDFDRSEVKPLLAPNLEAGKRLAKIYRPATTPSS